MDSYKESEIYRKFEGFGDLTWHNRHQDTSTNAESKKGEGGEEGTSTETGGDKEADGKDAQHLTQAQVNAIIANERRSWEKKLTAAEKKTKESDTKLTALTEEFGELKNWLKQIAESEEEPGSGDAQPQGSADTGDPELDAVLKELTPPPGIKDKELFVLVKRRELSERRRQSELSELVKNQSKQIDDLTKAIATEQKAREAADKARLNAVRDTELATALTDNRCIDVPAGIKLMRDNVFLDRELGKFRYKRMDGEVVSVADGVASELPKYMIQPATDAGGSGSAGSRVGTGAPTDSDITSLEKALLAAEKRAGQTGKQSDVTMYMVLKKKLAAAKKAKGL